VVAGLTPEYFLRQLMDFKNGARVTSDDRKGNTETMSEIAAALTDEEIRQVVDYFTQLPATPWIRVVETDMVPKMRSAGGILIPLMGDQAAMEPIGMRVIETPEDPEQTEKWRNSHSGFIAYAPVGSVALGEALVRTGDGRFTACTVCHGSDLRGLGPIPTIAGRSPSYVVRQLYDMQQGNRTGEWTELMAPVVAALEPEDLVNISAYLASLTP
jgi:cytochrome c553